MNYGLSQVEKIMEEKLDSWKICGNKSSIQHKLDKRFLKGIGHRAETTWLKTRKNTWFWTRKSTGLTGSPKELTDSLLKLLTYKPAGRGHNTISIFAVSNRENLTRHGEGINHNTVGQKASDLTLTGTQYRHWISCHQSHHWLVSKLMSFSVNMLAARGLLVKNHPSGGKKTLVSSCANLKWRYKIDPIPHWFLK